jgi:hypothetical protein
MALLGQERRPFTNLKGVHCEGCFARTANMQVPKEVMLEDATIYGNQRQNIGHKDTKPQRK